MKPQKPTLGITADYSYCCPVSELARTISKELEHTFEVKFLDLAPLRTASSDNTPPQTTNKILGDFLMQVSELDLLNINLEFGLFGNTFDTVFQHITKICEAAKKIIITVHSLHMNSPDFAEFYQTLFIKIKKITYEKSLLVLVNNERDQHYIQNVFGIEECKLFPLLFFSTDEAEKLIKKNTLRATTFIKNKLHFSIEDKDIVVGSFGYYQDHKDTLSTLKCIAHLPQNYKLLLVGRQHPRARNSMKKDENIMELVSFMEEHDKQFILYPELQYQCLRNRVAFLDLSHDDFFAALASVDIVVVNYLEAPLSVSAVLSQALQLERKIIASYSTTFDFAERFYPNSFERIDFGNYFQLRQKILTFSEEKIQNLKKNNEKWQLSKLRILCQEMISLVPEKKSSSQEMLIFDLNTYLQQINCNKAINNPTAGLRIGKVIFLQKGNGSEKGKAPDVSILPLLENNKRCLQLQVLKSCTPGHAMHWALRYQYPGEISTRQGKTVSATIKLKASEPLETKGFFLKLYDGIQDTCIAVTTLETEEKEFTVHQHIDLAAKSLMFDLTIAEGKDANLSQGININIVSLHLEVF